MCDFRKALILDTYYLGELSYALWESIQEDTDILTDILNNKQQIIDFIVYRRVFGRTFGYLRMRRLSYMERI